MNCALCIMHCASTHAQDSLLLRNYQFVKQHDPWLTSDNVAGLTHYQSRNIAEAEVSFSMGRGGFVNYNESPKTLSLDASVESFFRISPRTVVYGRMAYDNFTGRSMTGSAFLANSHSSFLLPPSSPPSTSPRTPSPTRAASIATPTPSPVPWE